MAAENISIEAFYSSLLKGVVLGVRCRNGHVMIPTKPTCTKCSSRDLSVITLSGNGKLVSYTEIFTPARQYEKLAPYFLGLVELEEGCRLLGRVIAPRDSIKKGLSLKVGFEGTPIGEWPKWPKIIFTP
ncbi:MAG: Zn-ribbon domain-containing OB-fold protein [Nitrososphaerales archaeon]